MSPTLTTFLFEAANFVLLAGVLAWLLFKPVRNAIEARRTAQAEQAEQTQAKLDEAESIRSDIAQQRNVLDDELESLRDEARSEAEREAEKTLVEAHRKAQHEYDAAKQRLSHLKSSEIERLSRVVATTTGELVSRLLAQLDTPDLESALTQAACRQLRALEDNSLEPVTVESAKPLTAEAQAALETVLGGSFASADFRVVPELGIGLRISTNRGLVDASSKGLAAFAERTLASQLEMGEGKEPFHD